MYFQSLPELIHMEGHGPFVWSAYVIVFVVVAVMVLGTRSRSRIALQRVRKRLDGARSPATPEA